MTRARQDLLVKNMIYTLKKDKIEIEIFRASRFFKDKAQKKNICTVTWGCKDFYGD